MHTNLFDPGIPVYITKGANHLDDQAIGYIKSPLVKQALEQGRNPTIRCGTHGPVQITSATVHRTINGNQHDSQGFVVDRATREKLKHSIEFKPIEVI